MTEEERQILANVRQVVNQHSEAIKKLVEKNKDLQRQLSRKNSEILDLNKKLESVALRVKNSNPFGGLF